MSNSSQMDLFGQRTEIELSIREAANTAGVSEATIKNWVKTGFLVSLRPNLVTLSSLDKFQSEIAGKEKLNKRANKSQKDSHNHEALVQRVKDSHRTKCAAILC